MSIDFLRRVLKDFRDGIHSSLRGEALFERAAAILGEASGADSVFIYYVQGHEVLRGSWRATSSTPLSHQPLFDPMKIVSGEQEIGTFFLSDIERVSIQPTLRETLKSQGVISAGIVPISQKGKNVGWIEAHFTEQYYRWRKEDTLLFEEVGAYCALASSSPTQESSFDHEAKSRYERLAYYGDLLILRTDPSMRVVEVTGDTLRILGVEPLELKNSSDVWARFLHPADLRRLGLKIRRLHTHAEPLDEEIRVLNKKTMQQHWLLLKGVPLYDQSRNVVGWEGFGLDITEKKLAQEDLVEERGRIEALYRVSRALQTGSDPAVVLLQGLKALLSTMNTDAGIACLHEAATERSEIVAAEGLSEQLLANINRELREGGFVEKVIASREININNALDRAPFEFLFREGIRSVLFAPLWSDGKRLGLLMFLDKRPNRYHEADAELLAVATGHISLAVHQAEVHSSERRHSSSLNALYRLTHELSKQPSPREIAEQAFPIIQSEIACKRLWLGTLNDQETHIVGQAGYGPGVRSAIINVQIELDLRHDGFDEAIRQRQPVVIDPRQNLECSGLTRIIKMLEPGSFAIVPLVSLGKVVGVLVVEPSSPSAFLLQRFLPLLVSMANEIATVLMSRRLELRMAETNKMRMAGLLASGIAHNFNNLLQAIMGQASLLDMQLPSDSPLSGSARMILSAAEKGASLVRQLLNFSTAPTKERTQVSLFEQFEESRDVYRSVLGTEISLVIKADQNLPRVLVNLPAFQQALTNLLLNAKEAINKKPGGEVRIVAKKVRLRSGEVDPELSPGHYVRIDIEDNGIGMDSEKRSRCFEPFFTTKNVEPATGIGFGGVGLGLSSAYAIVRSHDGIITVTSVPGEGSVFSIYLPCRGEPARASSPLESRIEVERNGAAAAQPAASRVLVRDDDTSEERK